MIHVDEQLGNTKKRLCPGRAEGLKSLYLRYFDGIQPIPTKYFLTVQQETTWGLLRMHLTRRITTFCFNLDH